MSENLLGDETGQRQAWNRVFATLTLLLSIVAGVLVGSSFESPLPWLVAFAMALAAQVWGRFAAHKYIAATGAKAFEDYADAWLAGWGLSLLLISALVVLARWL